jgi:hypothetical protein
VIKQGLLTRACIEIFYLKNLFITPVYNRLGLNTSQFNISNVEKLYQEFHPGQILPGGIAVKAQELLGVNQNDIEETYDVLFFTFCSSPSWLSH